MVVVLAVLVAVVGGLWAVTTVPVVSMDHHYRFAIVPYRIPYSTTYTGVSQLVVNSMLNGGTLSGTYWTPTGTTIHFWAGYGPTLFQSNNSSGSFHLTEPSGPETADFWFVEDSPATVYVNGTLSCLVPLSYVI